MNMKNEGSTKGKMFFGVGTKTKKTAEFAVHVTSVIINIWKMAHGIFKGFWVSWAYIFYY